MRINNLFGINYKTTNICNIMQYNIHIERDSRYTLYTRVYKKTYIGNFCSFCSFVVIL